MRAFDELRQLADDYWQAILDEEPTERHMLGDYSDVGSYEEASREGDERYAATLRDFATRAEALADGAARPGGGAHPRGDHQLRPRPRRPARHPLWVVATPTPCTASRAP